LQCRAILNSSIARLMADSSSGASTCPSRTAGVPLWAKREEQIRAVVESTAGLYGDPQGIAGRSLLEIDGLGLPLLDGPAGSEAAE
jgi:hypothetical protein